MENLSHCSITDYSDGHWGRVACRGTDQFRVSPFSPALNYAEAVFEGIRGVVSLNDCAVPFITQHAERLSRSAAALDFPTVPRELLEELIQKVIHYNSGHYANDKSDTYFRPVLYPRDNSLGYGKKRDNFTLSVAACKDFHNHPDGTQLRIIADPNRQRTGLNGIGWVKCAANYAAGLPGLMEARSAGYDDVLWVSSPEDRRITELSSMNIAFIVGDTNRIQFVTPKSDNSLLDGITRRALIKLASRNGLEVLEQNVSIDRLQHWLETGKVLGAVGTGTASGVVDIASITIGKTDYELSSKDCSTIEILRRKYQEASLSKPASIEDL